MYVYKIENLINGKKYIGITSNFSKRWSNHRYNSAFTLEGIEDLKSRYFKREHWKSTYSDYSEYCSEEHFWKIYTEKIYSLVMPEVFTKENKQKHSTKSVGSKNPRAKLTEDNVITMRRLFKEGTTRAELYEPYSSVSKTTVRNVINGDTWRHLL